MFQQCPGKALPSEFFREMRTQRLVELTRGEETHTVGLKQMYTHKKPQGRWKRCLLLDANPSLLGDCDNQSQMGQRTTSVSRICCPPLHLLSYLCLVFFLSPLLHLKLSAYHIPILKPLTSLKSSITSREFPGSPTVAQSSQ